MEALLLELCAEHGWCLTPSNHEALVTGETRSRASVLKEIIAAEFGEDHIIDRRTRTCLERLVDDWLFDPHGRGAVSGLPD